MLWMQTVYVSLRGNGLSAWKRRPIGQAKQINHISLRNSWMRYSWRLKSYSGKTLLMLSSLGFDLWLLFEAGCWAKQTFDLNWCSHPLVRRSALINECGLGQSGNQQNLPEVKLLPPRKVSVGIDNFSWMGCVSGVSSFLLIFFFLYVCLQLPFLFHFFL